MKRRLLLGGVPLVLLFVVGAAWLRARGASATAGPPVGRFELVDRGDVSVLVTETGTIEPLKKVEVKSKVAGRVARLTVQEGSRVRAGQLLAEIDPTEINSQVAQMQAQLDGARARLRQSERGVGYQAEQTDAAIRQAREALISARSRLAVARSERAAQPARTRSDIEQAEASLQSARDSLTLLQTSTHPQALVQARTGFEEAEASLANARRNVERNEKLLAKGFVSAQALDAARTELAGASARRDQAKSRIDLIAEQNRLERREAESRVAQARAALVRARADRTVQARGGEVAQAEAAAAQAAAQLRAALSGAAQNEMRRDDVAQARAGVIQLENQMREIAVRQGDTRILAPMNGVVTQRYVEQGELVTSGVSAFSSGQPVLQIANLSRMLVKMSINEVDVQRIRPGLPVEIAVDGARSVKFLGRVRKVAPAAVGSGGAGGGAQQASQSPGGRGGVIRFAVEVLVGQADERLRPGMSARCTVVIARKKNVLRVPESCVEGDGTKAKVQTLTRTTKDGKPVETWTPRTITAGLRGDSHIEIVAGLKQGDRVKPGAYSGPPRRAIEIGGP